MKKIIIWSLIAAAGLSAWAALFAFMVRQPDLTLMESVVRKFESHEERKERLHREALVREEMLKQEFLKQASCQPEKPLSRGEIYALAMQDYWKMQMNELWGAEKEISQLKEEGQFSDEIPSDINEQICQLERDEDGNPVRFGNKACYPWKLTEYDTFEKLQEWKDNGGKAENLEDLFGNEWKGEYYDPAKGFLQQPDFYNKESDFAVVQRDLNGTVWYPRDCCQLFNYNEMTEKGMNSIRYGNVWPKTVENELYFKKIYFLSIRSISIDNDVRTTRGIEFLPYPQDYMFPVVIFPVSPCGKIIFFPQRQRFAHPRIRRQRPSQHQRLLYLCQTSGRQFGICRQRTQPAGGEKPGAKPGLAAFGIRLVPTPDRWSS